LLQKKLFSLTQSLIKLCIEEGESIELASVGVQNESKLAKENSEISRTFRTWDMLLHLITDPLSIEYYPSKVIALEAILDSLSFWLDSIEKLRQKTKEEKILNAGKWESSVIPREFLPRGNTLLKIYAPYVFKITKIIDMKLENQRAKAFSVLCRLFGIRFDDVFDEIFLLEFFSLLHQGLIYGSSKVKCAIVSSSQNIFAVNLPGINLMIPDFVETCNIILTGRDSFDTQVCKSTISVFYSLTPLSLHYKDTLIPDIETAVAPVDEDSEEYRSRSTKILSNRPVNYSEVQKIALKS
jgi:hypothetical protein